MATIPLAGKHGGLAIVDDADLPLLSRCNWYGVRHEGGGLYVYGCPDKNGRAVSMHSYLMGRRPGMVIDHINGDPLDNRRANLRHCRAADNVKNSRKKIGTVSAYKGVSPVSTTGRWRAEIEADGERFHLGTFDSQKDAARQYDRAARLLHGQFARTNKMLGLLLWPMPDYRSAEAQGWR